MEHRHHAKGATTIKVMTFNIRYGMGTDRRLDLQRIAEVIRRSGADVVGLNEVDRHFSSRSGFVDQMQFLAQELRMHGAYGAALTFRSRESPGLRQYGNALLSRFPIVSHHNHVMNLYPGIIEGRALLEAQLDIQTRPVHVFVTHLSLNPFIHKRQTGLILRRIASLRHPILLLGDWNMRPGALAWRKINRHLTDVCLKVGETFYTYPSSRPRIQLDYIFASRHFQIRVAEVVRTCPEASDHLPLQVQLTLHE
jgi:endonuclease/exonuclease/phosphatase family metal-dependent hydrolase